MTQEIVLDQATIPEKKCAHHWLIEAAGGPTSQGKCRLCGETKQFQNFVEGGSWDDDRSARRDASGRRGAAVVRVADDDGDGDA